MTRLLALFLALAFFWSCTLLVQADEHLHSYQKNDRVYVWVNKVGPHSNPHETYPFYQLFQGCEPREKLERASSLGEIIEGNSVVRSHINFAFRNNVNDQEVCKVQLTEEDVERYISAVQDRYWFEMYIDDMPLWSQVGTLNPSGHPVSSSRGDEDDEKSVGSQQAAVFTHWKFVVLYNQDRIVGANVSATEPVIVQRGTVFRFLVSIKWVPSTIQFERRFDTYLEPRFFEHSVHWFALANGFMMAAFLATVVAMLLAKASGGSKDDDEAGLADDEAGWKRLGSQVFRVPPRLNMLTALVGTGAHVMAMLFCVLLAAIGSEMHTYRGGLTSAIIASYALTSVVGGAVSGAYYKRNDGVRWIQAMLLTLGLLPAVVSTIGLAITLVAWSYGALAALPFTTIVWLLMIWVVIAVPLGFVGTLLGRHMCGGAARTRPPAPPRPIPPVAWYAQRWLLVSVGGLLPFGAAFVETYFVFAALWHYKLYYVYGFASLALLCVVAVAACSAMVAVYIQLSSEDHAWPWTAFGAGACTGLYIFGYAVYYFLWRTYMSGLLQTLFFFGYSLLLCGVIAVMCGTVAYAAATLFVRRLYVNSKEE